MTTPLQQNSQASRVRARILLTTATSVNYDCICEKKFMGYRSRIAFTKKMRLKKVSSKEEGGEKVLKSFQSNHNEAAT